MEQVNIILPTRPKADIGDKDWILFDKEKFRDILFQAYYYPNTSLTINNVTVANRDVRISICGKTHSLGERRFNNVLDYLWNRLHYPASNIMCFKSNFENTEYIINRL